MFQSGMFEALWGVREYDAFYPFGTHVMLWFLQWVGGRPIRPGARGLPTFRLGARG